MKKLVLSTVALLVVLLGGWVGWGVVAGIRAEASLQTLKSEPQGVGGGLRIKKLTHDRGLLSSKGQAEVVFDPGCAVDQAADDALTMRVDYTMSHVILPGSATRIDWQAVPLGATAEEFKALFGSTELLSGSGIVGLDGVLRTQMALPQIAIRRPGEVLQIAPSKGFLSIQREAFSFGWQIDRLVTRGGGEAMEAKGIVVDLDLKNRYLGTGSTRFDLEYLSLTGGTVEGFTLRSEAIEKGDRLDMTVTPSIRKLKASKGPELTDLSLQIALKGMDVRSVETLTRLFESSCGMQSLTADEGRIAREAIVKLLARGLAMGIPKISGQSADGGVSGELMLELAESRDGKPSLATQFKTQGRIEIAGALIPTEQRDMIVSEGFGSAKGAGLIAAFEYANGVLKVNDRTHDASQVMIALQAADQQLQAAVVGWSQTPDTRRPAKPVAADRGAGAVVSAPAASGSDPAPAAVSQAPASSAATVSSPQTPTAPTAPVTTGIDGNWYSQEWRYGYVLKNGVGKATSTNSENFRVGQEIIFLEPGGNGVFKGRQVYTDGKFYAVTAVLQPNGELQFTGERNARWVMRRVD